MKKDEGDGDGGWRPKGPRPLAREDFLSLEFRERKKIYKPVQKGGCQPL